MADQSVKFHLPGLSFNYPVNMLLLDLMKKKPEFFHEGIEVGSFFGEFPTSLWNGGRFSFGVQCPKEMVQSVVRNINDQGIPVRYTFTNPMITKEDLADPYCNFCMEVGDNGMNEVLVFSPILEQYIRDKYPGYRISSTTCKEIKDIDRLHAELDKGYHLVVLDQNMNREYEFLEKIKERARIELLVNPCCGFQCARRKEHYIVVSAEQRIVLANREIQAGKDPREVIDHLPDYVKERMTEDEKQGKFRADAAGRPVIQIPEWHCQYGEYNTPYSVRQNQNYISTEEIWEKYVPMGFVNFKLEGRTASIFSVVDDYVNYLCRPEHRDEARYILLTQLNGQGILHVRRTWWNNRGQ